MARGAFNTTADFFQGPRSSNPANLIFTGPVRLVIADAILLANPNAPNHFGWVTVGAYIPQDPVIPDGYAVDAGLADQVAVPSGSGVQWWVERCEVINWGSQPTYYRASLSPLPVPARKVAFAGNVHVNGFSNIMSFLFGQGGFPGDVAVGDLVDLAGVPQGTTITGWAGSANWILSYALPGPIGITAVATCY